jgi:DNA replication protein DnaC
MTRIRGVAVTDNRGAMEAVTPCPHCDGSGWKTVERNGVSGVERCECSFDGLAAKMESRAGIPPRYEDASFDNFSIVTGNPASDRILQRAITAARSYARNFPFDTRKQGLLLVGDSGTGKTHLAVAVLRELIARGHEGVFFLYQNLLERIQRSYDKASGAADRQAFQVALDCEILLLDDLGAHRITEWVEDTITSIITHRCNNNKPIIATTNLRDPDAGDSPLPSGPAGEIRSRFYLEERIGTRARSRLSEMCQIVSMRGAEDYRRRR